MQDPIFIVMPVPIAGWLMWRAGTFPAYRFAERWSALECAHLLAQDHRPSVVKVKNRDGSVEEEWVYRMNREERLLPRSLPQMHRLSTEELI